MSTETEIQSDIEALRGRFRDTKALYREACALLFFRYGITPTASKLYQYVRKGSMGAPTEALTKFWDDLRSKARVEIDHPDLPPELKTTAAEAIAGIWRQATAAARAEMAAMRIEIQAELERSHDEQRRARKAVEDAQIVEAALQLQLSDTQEAIRQAHSELEAERRTHAAAAARLQELQRHFDEARLQQERLRRDFSADLAKAREAVDTANARADAAERRALLEIDQERQSRVKLEKQLEAQRAQLTLAEARHRDAAHEHADAMARLQARVDAAQESQRLLTDQTNEMSATLQVTGQQLDSAQQEALQHRTEAQTLRVLMDRLAPSSREAEQPRLVSKPVRKSRAP
jgi:chromosome segregation ATPase